ncbi:MULTISPECIES: putative signal transducing protein [unclassified Nitrospina]|uniref:putative signal transducing protein n=1 Tax=unclassified Nitrospina TaxID=2638683 RepID=UPI003F9B838C
MDSAIDSSFTGSGDGMTELVTIARYSMPYEAHLAKARLEAEGIPVFIADEHLLSINWLYTPAVGGIKVQVPEDWVDAAKDILTTDHQDEIAEIDTEPPLTCPRCGGTHATMVLGDPLMLLLTFALLGAPLFFLRETMKCHTCGTTFKRPKQPTPTE